MAWVGWMEVQLELERGEPVGLEEVGMGRVAMARAAAGLAGTEVPLVGVEGVMECLKVGQAEKQVEEAREEEETAVVAVVEGGLVEEVPAVGAKEVVAVVAAKLAGSAVVALAVEASVEAVSEAAELADQQEVVGAFVA